MWTKFKAFFAPSVIDISPEDYAWMLANPEKVGDYIRARIILG